MHEEGTQGVAPVAERVNVSPWVCGGAREQVLVTQGLSGPFWALD